jgi:hypothetical protein
MAFLALMAVFGGCFLAFRIARLCSWSGAAKFIGATFLAVVLGIGLTFVTGVSHNICHGVLKMCIATTDMTIYDIVYPLYAIPLYWIIMLTTGASTTEEEES